MPFIFAVATIFVAARNTGVELTESVNPALAGYLNIARPEPPAPLVPPLQQPEVLVTSKTDNLPAGATIPAVPAETKSSFWDFFSSSKSADGQAATQPETLGPGAINTPPAKESKQ